MATPSRLSSSMISNKAPVSLSVSEDVGSSMISSAAFSARALAISTICRCATDSVPTSASGATASLSRSSRPRASARMRAWSTNRPLRGSRPRKMFSATDRCEAAWLAAVHDLAGVGLVHAAEYFHQGRLARAVLAAQRVHFAPEHVEVHAVERHHAGKALGDAAHRQQRLLIAHGRLEHGLAPLSRRSAPRPRRAPSGAVRPGR